MVTVSIEWYEGGGKGGVNMFDGTIREEPGQSVRATEGELEGVTGKVLRYSMWDATPMKPKPECFELVTFKFKQDADREAWYREWSQVSKGITAFKGCPYLALGKGIDDPLSAIQIQPWTTLEDHLVGFKQAPNVDEVMAPLRIVTAKYIEGNRAGQKGVHVML